LRPGCLGTDQCPDAQPTPVQDDWVYLAGRPTTLANNVRIRTDCQQNGHDDVGDFRHIILAESSLTQPWRPKPDSAGEPGSSVAVDRVAIAHYADLFQESGSHIAI
jgi:hypothetical protein